MTKSELKTNHLPTHRAPQIEREDDSSLRGTLVSVFMIGAFIVITWVSVFYLFMSRN